MTSAGAVDYQSPTAPAKPVAPPPPRSRSLFRQALRDTWTKVGARIGLTWILLVVTVGVFAPLIANSHPILLKQGGLWSSPMLRHMTWVDFTLGTLYLLTLGTLLLMRRTSTRGRLLVIAGGTLFVGLITCFAVEPPRTLTYSLYREAEAAGETELVLRTFVPYSPNDRFIDRSEPSQNLAPSATHLMGTTANGEDVLSRMIHASRIAVSIGFIATGISFVIGVTIGAVMGYFARSVDMIGMRLIEIFEAIPTLFLLIMLVAFYGRNLYLMMVIIGLVSWTGNARFIRAEFLRLRKMDFVQASIALGLPLRSILFRHMLPNGLTPVLISCSFGVASAILAEATLSFLGLGLVEEPSWGQMLDQARGVGTSFHWWMAAFPGGAIFLTVLAYNLIGEALRDALDPKLLKRE